MKRIGYLIGQIADLENLRLAFWKAKKKKGGKKDVYEFGADLDKNLLSLSNEISSGMVSVGDYSYFKVYEPKERTICAANFRERVLHHALMNINPAVINLNYLLSLALFFGDGALPRNAPIR